MEEPRVDLDAELIGDIKFNQVTFRYGTRSSIFKILALRLIVKNVLQFSGEWKREINFTGTTTEFVSITRRNDNDRGKRYLIY